VDAGKSWSLRPQQVALSQRCDRRGMVACRAAASASQARRRQAQGDLREVINGLLYVLSTGCQWRAIPKDLPPKSTVYDYFDLWDGDGTLDRIPAALYVKCHETAGREASPTAAIIDSQSVKSAEKGGAASIRRAMTRARRSRARSGTSSSIRKAC